MIEALVMKIENLDYIWNECGYDGIVTRSEDFEHMEELTHKKQYIKAYIEFLKGEK